MIFFKNDKRRWLVALLFVSVATGVASAADFQSLVSNGFQIGNMSKNKGYVGWVLTKGKKKFFCQINPSLVKTSENKFYLIDTSGKLVDWEKRPMRGMGMMINPSAIPRLDDLKTGRVPVINVGACSPVH